MTSFTQTDSRLVKVGALCFGLLGLALLGGCIADTAEDTELPWASNKNWEGIAPIAPSVMDRYD